MSLSRVIVLVVLLAAPVASASATTTARTAASTAAIACPLLRGDVVTCCGPPVAAGTSAAEAGAAACCAAESTSCCPVTPTPADLATVCCPANAVCAEPSLTISAAPSSIVAGAPVTISGELSGGDGATVTLWQASSDGSYAQAATTTTDASGAYSFARAAGTVLTNTSWYVTSGTSRSTTVAESVSAKVTVAPGPVSIAVGRRVSIRGSVDPGQSGERVLLLRRAGHDWDVIARARLNRASRYVLHHRFARGGTLRLRVELAGDARNVQSFSRTLTLTVARRA